MRIEVIKAGLAVSVQDLGRPGYYHLGIPMSGAMDRFALRAANLLVGNPEDSAGLEVAFMGPELRFEGPAVVAVTGADLPPKLDGAVLPTWTSFAVKAGQVLSFGHLKAGARAYIAISGGVDVPLVLGSRSTYALCALGGVEGRNLRVDDVLPVGTASENARPDRTLTPERRPSNESPATLRMVRGLYDFRVTPTAIERFFDDTWKVAPEADRIGYRFRGGQPLEFVERTQPFGAGSDPSNIVDSCYPYGSIQIPGGTEPIVLHRDAVSGGGYFMVGTVISADMDRIGQLQPHMPARFVPVTLDAALEARAEEHARTRKLREALR